MLELLIASVSAEGGAAAQGQNAWVQMAPLAIIFIIFYFLMIKPQKKRLEQEQMMLSGLSKGDEIYTKSGILGTIVGMTEKIITLEVNDGVKMKVLRDQVGGLSSKLFEKKEK